MPVRYHWFHATWTVRPACAVCSVLLATAATVTSAEAAPLQCIASVPSVAIVNVLSPASGVGDLSVSCSGGEPSLAAPITVTVFFNTSVSTLSAATLTTGSLDLSGAREGANAVRFTDLPLVPDLRFHVTGVLVNTEQLGFSSTPIPTQVVSFISITGPVTVVLNNPQQTVALIAPATSVPEPTPLLLLAVSMLPWMRARTSRVWRRGRSC